MGTQAKEKCPLCLETMDLTDKQLKPCKCGYEICLWCWHHIMEMDQKDECGGRCPGCRSIYNKDRILGTSINNQILSKICADKTNLHKEQTKPQKQIDPNNARVIQRKLVYIVGMPSEFTSDKVLRQKKFLGQYGKIENIITDNIGANQQIPDSGRVYVTFSREEEAVRCIEAVNGYILDGRPLKATFGVTRYCHVWLNNKVCRKPNCSYVHQKAPAEDICTKDEVAVVCARLQHMLGMNMKGSQQRSGSTLPSPGDSSSRATICSGNYNDKIQMNDGGGALPNAGNKNHGTLPAATPRDSCVFSGNSSSNVNATPHQLNNHENILNEQNISACKSQDLPVVGLKDRLNEQLASNDNKSQASAQLGNSKQMTSAGNGTVDTTLRKPQYVNVVSQAPSGSGRRFTVLTRQLPSADTRSKATGQVDGGISNSKKLTLPKDESSDSITISRCQNAKVVSQKPEQSSRRLNNQLSSAIVKSHFGSEEKNPCSDISDRPAQGKHMRLPLSTVSRHSIALQRSSGSSTMPSHLSTSDAKSQVSVGPDKLSDSHRELASENQSQLLNQQKTDVSNTDVASASDYRSIVNNHFLSADGKHSTSQGGDHSLYNRKMTLSRDQATSQHAKNILLTRPVSVLSSTNVEPKDCKGRKRQVCPPGFKELHRSSDSGKFVSVSSSTCSTLCSTSDAQVQDRWPATDQQYSWVSECLEDDGDTKQSNSVSKSSTLSSTDTIWRYTQISGSCFCGASNHRLLSPYPVGLLQCMGGVENTMRCCCAFPSVSSTPNKKSEYWDGSDNCYMSTGGYDSFSQNATSAIRAGMVGTILQQSSPPGLYNDWSNGSVDSGLKSAQVDLSYPMYTLF